jgi:hypothetical protein
MAGGAGRQRWRKLGCIFEPVRDAARLGSRAWMVSHAALPIAVPLGPGHPGRLRVYLSGRDAHGRAQIGALELELPDPADLPDPTNRPDPTSGQPARLLALGERPVVALGPLGAFDDSGVTGSCIVSHRGRLYLYYTGWSLGRTVPFYYFVGLAVSDDGGQSFAKHSLAPIMDRSPADPFLTASPWVLVRDDGWHMWYVSGARWEIHDGQPRHYYRIQYASSDDGIAWRGDGAPCLDFEDGEYAFGRPTVLADADGYRMWFSVRGERYRLGYAESQDGRHWRRLDHQVGLDVGDSGWDAEMITYPHVFEHRGRLWMLYNGNGYGRSGLGLAVLDA